MTMPGPYSMTLAEKQARRKTIVELWQEGSPPTEIARRFKLTANYIRVVLAAAGIDVEAANDARARVDAIWDMDDDQRRREIATRAANAARQQLIANRQAILDAP